MRRLHWLAWVASLLVISTGAGNCAAQTTGNPGAEPQPPTPIRGISTGGTARVESAGAGSPAAGPAGTGFPSNAAGIPTHHSVATPPPGGASWQPGMQPYPSVSPYRDRFEQHTVEDGLWQREIRNGPREYFFTLEAIAEASFKDPGAAIIGDPDRFSLLIREIEFFEFDDDDDEVDDFRRGVDTPLRFNQFIPEVPDTPGIRLRWGFREVDQTGVEFSGWWISDVSRTGSLLSEVEDPDDEDDDGDLVEIESEQIPIDDGTELGPPAEDDEDDDDDTDDADRDLIGPGGIFSPLDDERLIQGVLTGFDEDFFVRNRHEAYGADVHVSRPPFWQSDHMRIRMLYGLKYLHIQEDVGLVGRGTTPVDPAFPRVTTERPTTFLDSETRHHLAGPEIGLQYSVGGDNFQIVGRSAFALFVNREKLALRGENFGTPTAIDEFGPMPFSEDERHTHASPAFYQSLHGEMRIFHMVPLLRNWSFLENARLRLGLDFQLVGEVARPADAIVYNGIPRTPKIDVNRSTWWVFGWSAGVNWRY